jgi:TonB family protein
MLDRLDEFERSNGRQVGSAAFALVLHVALILVVVRATNAAASASLTAARDTIRVELAPPPGPRPFSDPSSRSHAPLPAPPPPIDLRAEPLRLDFPAFDHGPPRLDLRALAGLSAPADSSAARGGSGSSGTALPVEEADQAPALLGGLQPRYPESLQSTGLAGSVELEYLISTTGRVEPGSVRVRRSTHQAFTEAARQALLGARFTPARRGGRPVAVLVRQTMRFIVR